MLPGTGSGIAVCVVPTYSAILVLHLVDLANAGCLQVRKVVSTAKTQSCFCCSFLISSLEKKLLQKILPYDPLVVPV